jgi:malonate decarboxylase delta subunit
METFVYRHTTLHCAAGSRTWALIGVVASGNLEVLVERVLTAQECEIHVRTAAEGFGDIWQAVVADLVQRLSPGSLRFSINDGGARPDMVSLRLTQAMMAVSCETA